MATLILTNNFHHTEITLHSKEGRLSKEQVKRARRVLCGIETCTCGGLAGERGPNPQLEFHQDGSARVMEE